MEDPIGISTKELLPFRRRQGEKEAIVSADGLGVTGGRFKGENRFAAFLKNLRVQKNNTVSKVCFPFSEIKEMTLAFPRKPDHAKCEIITNKEVWKGTLPFSPDSLPAQWMIECLGDRITAKEQKFSGRLDSIARVFLAVVAFISLMAFAISKEAESPKGLWISGTISVSTIVLIFLVFNKPIREAKDKRRKTLSEIPAQRPETPIALVRLMRVIASGIIIASFYVGILMQEALWEVESLAGFRYLLLLIVQWTILGLGVALLVFAHFKGQRDGRRLLEKSDKKPILYLRSFSDDDQHTFTEESLVAHLCTLMTPSFLSKTQSRFSRAIGLSTSNLERFITSGLALPLRVTKLALGRCSDTAEEQLTVALREFGPVVAIGNPYEIQRTPGAARLYVSHDGWQEEVASLVSTSGLIIIQPSGTAGVWWEMEHLFEKADPKKVLLSLSALTDADARDLARARIESILGKSIDWNVMNSEMVSFDQNWTPQPLTEIKANPFKWPWLGASLNLRKTLDPWLRDSASPKAKPLSPIRNFAQRWAAATVYGIAPITLGLGLQFIVPISDAVGGDFSGETKVIAVGTVTLPIDTAWEQTENTVGRSDVAGFTMGATRVFSVAFISTDKVSSTATLGPSDFKTFALKSFLNPSQSNLVGVPKKERLGNRSWTHQIVDLEIQGKSRSRAWIWATKLDDGWYVILTREDRINVGVAGDERGPWNQDLPKAAREAISKLAQGN